MYSRRSAVFTPRRRRRWTFWLKGFLLLLLGVVLLAAVYAAFDNGRVVVRTQRAVVHDLPSSLEGFTVLHISDLSGKQFGPQQKQVLNSLKGKKYNAVCITGDMIGSNGDVYPFYELLSALDVGKPVYFISGDSDPIAVGAQASSYNVLAEWVLGAQARGATYLGAPASLTVGNDTVWFSDASQLTMDLSGAIAAYTTSDTALGSFYAEMLEQTRQARLRMGDAGLHIALSHNPISGEISERMQSIASADGQEFLRTVDLFLAGGTVGGQWRIPFVGPVWSNGWFPDDTQVLGYQRAGILPQSQYITAGLGINPNNPLPGFRLFNTPSVTLITFTSEMDI